MDTDLTTELFGPREPFAGHARYQRVGSALKIIGIGRSKLYDLIRKGLIAAKKVDNCTFVDLSSVATLFEACPQITPATYNTLTAEQLGLRMTDIPVGDSSGSGSLNSIRLEDGDLARLNDGNHD